MQIEIPGKPSIPMIAKPSFLPRPWLAPLYFDITFNLPVLVSTLKRFAIIVAVFCAMLVSLSSSQAKQQEKNEKVTQLKTFMETASDRGSFRGAIVVVESGEVIFEFAHGDAENKKRVTSVDSAFYLASVSKQFTSAAILLLSQDGKLAFEDPISKHLPSLPKWSEGITIQHLLTNTSGLGDYLEEGLEKNGLTNQVVMKHIQGLKKTKFVPGEKYGYSNTGYFLLARIVERISGLSFREFTSKRIFQSLEMESSVFIDETKPAIKERAFGYDRYGRLDDTPMLINGAGGMFASASDLAKWNIALFGEEFLNKATKERAFSTAKLNDGSNSSYGFGWHVHDRGEGKLLHHTGSLAGFRNFVFVDLKKKNVVIILTNGGNSFPLSQMATGITNILRGKPAVAPKTALVDHLFSYSKRQPGQLGGEIERIQKDQTENFRISEDDLNELGYVFLENKQLDEAMDVFQMLVHRFPKSANVYDSYAEALMVAGKHQLSLENYQRSLELAPSNDNARAMIERLEKLIK